MNVKDEMQENTASIWEDDTWEVACPPSVPDELWNQVPENFKREFIIEAAFALRRGIHPIDTLEELFEERGIALDKRYLGKKEEPESKKKHLSLMRKRPDVKNASNAKKNNTQTTFNNVKNKLWPSRPVMHAKRPVLNSAFGRPIKKAAHLENVPQRAVLMVVDDIGDTF